MLPPELDLAARRPVWQALSDLFLDTELSPAVCAGNARVLASSPYSVDELRRILFDEVHPACSRNLLAVAGVWTGFDAGWLESRILARRRARLRWPARLLPLRAAIRSQIDELLAQVAELRATGPG
jgi:hypothetical protein